MPVILLVEDDALILLMLAEELKELGYEVLTAVDASAAMNFIDRGLIVDLLLTDINLPGGMDGVGLTGLVRKQLPLIHIVGMSGRPDSQLRLTMFDQNIAFFSKPFDIGAMMDHIEACVPLS